MFFNKKYTMDKIFLMSASDHSIRGKTAPTPQRA